jgi:DnaJ-domain-containing protein 1
MSFLSRLSNIIRSNINFRNEEPVKEEIKLDNYEDLYSSDAKEEPIKYNKEAEYYANLELEYGVGFDEIKKAYRRLLKKYHPDLFQNNPEKLEAARQVTKRINEAYNYFERKYL